MNRKRKLDEMIAEGATAPKFSFAKRDYVPGMDARMSNYAEV